MAFFKAMGKALGAPLRAPGMGAITKPMNKMMGATPGMRGIPAALGMGQQKPQPGIGPSPMGGLAQRVGQMGSQMGMKPQMQPPPQQQQPPPEAMDQQKMLADYQQQGQAAGQDMGWMQRPGVIQMGPQQDPQEQQRSKLAQMFQQMRGRSPMQGGGQQDPRFQTMGRPQGRGFGIGPQLNMMPQQMAQPQAPPQEQQY